MNLVTLLFFGSGATALVYEVVWSKYLSLLLGSTVQAQTVVLAVFMGGLALGNRLFGGFADRTCQPLSAYGRIEVAIGLYAFFFQELYTAADALFRSLGHDRLEAPLLLLGLKAFLSVGLLLGPTLLMGGTLPLLAGWLQRRHGNASQASARFYAINSLGAVTGSFLAGFVLIQSLGMVSALQLTAMTNVLIGLTAIARSRSEVGSVAPPPKPEGLKQAGSPTTPAERILRTGCLTVAVSGAVSMGLEVLASRSLALIFGASLQSFAVVLMAFILGIGLGSLLIASRTGDNSPRTAGTVGLLLAGAGTVALLVLGITRWVDIYTLAKNGLSQSSMGYIYYQVMTGGMALIVLGIPAGLLGAVLPLWIRNLQSADAGLGGQVGRLLTWNTVGAVVGTLVTGFVLMPRLGIRASFFTLVLILCAAAALMAWLQGRRLAAIGSGATGLMLLGLSMGTGEGWREILSSGAFRLHGSDVDPAHLRDIRKSLKIVFYEDAADATVTVEKGDGHRMADQYTLRINGKADASTHGDLSTQYLLAHLPMLARPESKDVFVLGFGSGITAGAILGHPIQSLTIAENCEPVLRAAKFFYPLNRGVWTNALTRLRNEDARTVLKLGTKAYDIIISEPSNPWMVGVGSVFSQEFYRLCASRLKPGGIMTQWFHAYEMNDGIVSLILRTFQSVFPEMEVWDTQQGDLVLVGSQTPWPTGPSVFRKVFERPQPRADLEHIGIHSPEAVWARQVASRRTAPSIAEPGPVQSDLFPVLEYRAPEAFFIAEHSRLLWIYDERTWQIDLAPREKNDVLSHLPPSQVHEVFQDYLSVNADLVRLINARFPTNGAPSEPEVLVSGQHAPLVFNDGQPRPHRLLIPNGADPELQQALAAEHAILEETTGWQEASDRLVAIITRHREPMVGSGPTAWSPVALIKSVTPTLIARGEWGRAAALVRVGLEREPAAPYLRYLGRILQARMTPPKP